METTIHDLQELSKEIDEKTDFIEIAKNIIEKIPLFYSEKEGWFIYSENEYKWIGVTQHEILNAVRSRFKFKNVTDWHLQKELFEGLKLIALEKKPKELNNFQAQFKDKIVDYRTGEIINATAEYFTLNPIPYSIGNSTTTPTIDKLFREWTNETDMLTLKEWFAYCTFKDCFLEECLVLLGSGSNGKTKFQELILKFLGENNVSHSSFQELFLSRFGKTALYHKLLINLPEMNFNVVKDTEQFKSIVSGNYISLEEKNCPRFDYKTYSKICISTNQLPITKDHSDGFHRRWILIRFGKEFQKKVGLLDEIPEIEYENLALFCVQKAKELINKGELTYEGTTDSKRKLYEKYSDPLTQFIDKNCYDEYGEWISTSEFKIKFFDFLRRHKYNRWSGKELNSEMKGAYIYTHVQENDDSYIRIWKGIGWKDNPKVSKLDVEEETVE